MRLKITFEVQAENDLTDLSDFITEKADARTAERFADRLLSRCKSLVTAPGKGTPYKRRLGVRKIIEGNYQIFYRFTEAEVIILRIWDGRRGSAPKLKP